MTLRDLIEMASGHAEAMFDPQETMMMRHICEKADGAIEIMVCPVATVAEEVMFRVRLPKTFPGEYARWVFVSEAWTAEMSSGEPLPSRHPARMEIVAFYATESATGETLIAHRQIYRPAIGGAKLLPLVYEKKGPLFVMDGKA
jgi:hypothetical protein